MSGPLAQLASAHVRFAARGGGQVHALNGVDLAVARGGALGLVGESGSGKSTTGLAMLRLRRLTEGRVLFDGLDITDMPERRLRAMRRRLQPVFQDPRAALNPRRTLAQSVAEPLRIHRLARGAALDEAVDHLFEDVGLGPQHRDRFPDELSGGQLQRACIARALASSPELLMLDEPISSLDVSVAAQVLNLLAELREKRQLSFLFIAHDLHAVAHLCADVAVMYLGRIVEEGPAASVLSQPAHPYTRALVASVPSTDGPGHLPEVGLHGEPPSPLAPPRGCPVHPRCPVATARCREELPKLRPVSYDRRVACHHV